MHARAVGFLGVLMCLLALLAGCGGGGEGGRAAIVSVSPAQVDLLSDEEFGAVQLHVVLSGDTRQRVCGSSSGVDFPFTYALQAQPGSWDVTFEADPSLSVGEHIGYLEVFTSSDPGCERRDGESQQVPYRLSRVNGFAWPGDAWLLATADTTADELRGSARIDMAAGPQHAWAARSLSPWLVVDAASGLTGSDVRFHVDPASMGSTLENGGFNEGSIEITGDTEGMSPRFVSVYLKMELAEARAAMPADQPAGPARHLRVHGVGFTSEAMASARVSVEGVPGAALTRLADGDLTVELPASLPVGTYRVVTSNALGVPNGSAAFRLTAPVETGRAVLPGHGAGGRMLWDGARSALLVLEPPSSPPIQYSTTLSRHALRDGVWTTTGHWVAMLRRMGLSPDGAQLVAASDADWSDPWIYAYDPETLHVIGRYASIPDELPEPPSRVPLAVTVDGRAWSGTLNALLTYDLAATYRVGIVVPSTWAPNYLPESTIASRDGGRLLVSRGGAGAFAYLDVADGVFHLNASGATTFDAISDDGGRVLCGANVYDGDFALVGTLPGPGIISGDGRRAFTLEARSDWQTGGPAPVVHVFDLIAPAAGGGALAELGTVDLLDHATCAAGERVCAPTSSLAVTPDGRVLFAQTDGGVVVVPVPQSLAGP